MRLEFSTPIAKISIETHRGVSQHMTTHELADLAEALKVATQPFTRKIVAATRKENADQYKALAFNPAASLSSRVDAVRSYFFATGEIFTVEGDKRAQKVNELVKVRLPDWTARMAGAQ